MRDLSGKTIESFVMNPYHGNEVERIRFTDGTTLLFEREYEDVTVKLLTDRALAQLERRREVWSARCDQRREDARRAEEIKKARIARARSVLSRRVFEDWRHRTYPTMHEVLRDVWSKGALQAAFSGESVLIPIRKAA